MKKRTRRHVLYKNDNFGFFLLLELSPLLVFEFDFLSLHEYSTEYFVDAWYKCRTGRDDMLRTRMLWWDWGGGHLFFFSKKNFSSCLLNYNLQIVALLVIY